MAAERTALPSLVSSATLTLLGICLVALGVVELAVALAASPRLATWVLLLYPLCAWTYGAAGLLAWSRRPSNRTGPLLIAGCLAFLLAGLVDCPQPALFAAGLVVATLPLAVIVHMLHGFPSGRLRGRLSLVTVVAGYFTSLVLQVPLYLFGPPSPLQIRPDPSLHDAAVWVQRGASIAVLVVTIGLLGTRFRQASPARRRILGPLFVYGILAVAFIPVSSIVFRHDGIRLFTTQVAVLAGVPIAFSLAVLRGGFARTGELVELGTWLGSEAPTRPSLAFALADTVGDPTLELAFWTDELPGYVDRDGRPVPAPGTLPGRAAVEVALGGRPVGAIDYDGTLVGDPELVRSAGRILALAVDHERLTADLRASRERLRASGARAANAADAERRRIARDLHDGLQTRLVLLALHADELATSGSPATLANLQEGLQRAITELRDLVQGVMPAMLTERGLSAAIRDLAAGLPIAVELDLRMDGLRLPPAVESSAYFVVSEAVTNALKHSGTDRLVVCLQATGNWLRVEVSDDGTGGARPDGGRGLGAMDDRVAALGGRLTVDSRPGLGTTLRVELPCGS